MLLLALLIAAVVPSAFYSNSETTFISLQRIRLRHIERAGVPGVAHVKRLVAQAERTLVTVLSVYGRGVGNVRIVRED